MENEWRSTRRHKVQDQETRAYIICLKTKWCAHCANKYLKTLIPRDTYRKQTNQGKLKKGNIKRGDCQKEGTAFIQKYSSHSVSEAGKIQQGTSEALQVAVDHRFTFHSLHRHSGTLSPLISDLSPSWKLIFLSEREKASLRSALFCRPICCSPSAVVSIRGRGMAVLCSGVCERAREGDGSPVSVCHSLSLSYHPSLQSGLMNKAIEQQILSLCKITDTHTQVRVPRPMHRPNTSHVFPRENEK